MRILKFSASWCNPCKMLSKRMEILGLEAEEVDIDAKPDLADRYGIMSVPTLIKINDEGEELSRLSTSIEDSVLRKFFA